MTVRVRTHEHDRLQVDPSAPASSQLRCSCDRCGAHLLARPRADGAFDGHCPVCIGQRFTPVWAPHLAG